MSVQPWRALSGGVKDYLDTSVRSGRAYSGSDRSARSGNRFYDDSSTKSGRAYYDDASAKSGRAYYGGETSAHAGKVYESIPEYTGRPSQDLYVDGGSTPQQQRRVTVADLQQQVQSNRSLSSFAEDGVSSSPATASSKRVHKLTPL